MSLRPKSELITNNFTNPIGVGAARASVAGLARTRILRALQGQRRAPTLAVDYGSVRREDAEVSGDAAGRPADGAAPPDSALCPLLVARCDADRWLTGAVVPRKGAVPFARDLLTKELRNVGAGWILLRNDGEPSILALKRAAGDLFTLETGRTVVEEVAQDSPGNGLAEGGVRDIEAKIRTLRFDLEESLGQPLPDDHATFAWLVPWAATSVNLARRGRDGRTPYELRTGRAWRRPLPRFGEKVLWRSTPGAMAPGRTEWQTGVFVGLQNGGLGNDSLMVASHAGAQKSA